MRETEQHVAYHEVGHFVVGRAFGFDCDFHVTIVPHGDAVGQVVGQYPLGDTFDDADVEAVIVILYAGYTAQVRFDPSSCEWARGTAADDDERAQEFIRLLSSGEDPADVEQRLRCRSAELVAEHWTSIEALAAELLKEKTLDDYEAQLIVDIACGRAKSVELENYRLLRVGQPEGGST